MDENRTVCPCCPNHCEAGALQCGKGRAYFENGEKGGDGTQMEHSMSGEQVRHVNAGEEGHRREEGHKRAKKEGREWMQGRECKEGREWLHGRAHGEENLHKRSRTEREEHGRQDFIIEEKLQGQLRACGHFLHYNTGEKAGQARILSALLEHGIITQRELQDVLEVRSGSLSEILNKVEADGFIERSQSESDKRQLDVKLTEAGMAAAARAEEERGHVAAELFTNLSDGEKRTLAQLLDKLLDGWEGPDRERGRRNRARKR